MGAVYEFIVHNVDFGAADSRTPFTLSGGHKAEAHDKIEFVLGGRTWTLRKCVFWDGDFIPVDAAEILAAAAGTTFENTTLQPQCALQVPVSALPEIEAQKMANDICSLLGLALGRRVAWNRLGIRDGGKLEFRQFTAARISTGPIGQRIVVNSGDGTFKRYLEHAFPIFTQHPDWWRVTIDWFIFSHEAHTVQVSGLICSMLFDRVTRHVLAAEKFAKQIDEVLVTDLDPKSAARSDLAKKLDVMFRAEISPKWNKTDAVLDAIRQWNNEPSYSAKTKLVFDRLNLPVPPKPVLDNRHSLAHDGELKSGTHPAGYYQDVSRIVVALLLRMLGYSGRYFVVGLGEQHLAPVTAKT